MNEENCPNWLYNEFCVIHDIYYVIAAILVVISFIFPYWLILKKFNIKVNFSSKKGVLNLFISIIAANVYFGSLAILLIDLDNQILVIIGITVALTTMYVGIFSLIAVFIVLINLSNALIKAFKNQMLDQEELEDDMIDEELLDKKS